MPADDADSPFLHDARGRAWLLLNSVGGDLDALRAAASDAAYADGAALCEQVADAARQLMVQLDAELAGGVEPSPTEGTNP